MFAATDTVLNCFLIFYCVCMFWSWIVKRVVFFITKASIFCFQSLFYFQNLLIFFWKHYSPTQSFYHFVRRPTYSTVRLYMFFEENNLTFICKSMKYAQKQTNAASQPRVIILISRNMNLRQEITPRKKRIC